MPGDIYDVINVFTSIPTMAVGKTWRVAANTGRRLWGDMPAKNFIEGGARLAIGKRKKSPKNFFMEGERIKEQNPTIDKVDSDFQISGHKPLPETVEHALITPENLKAIKNSKGRSLYDFLEDKVTNAAYKNLFKQSIALSEEDDDKLKVAKQKLEDAKERMEHVLANTKTGFDKLNEDIKRASDPQNPEIPKNYTSLILMARAQKVKLNEAIAEYQKAEAEVFNTELDVKSKKPEYKKAINEFYGCNNNEDKISKKSVELQNAQLKAFREQQSQNKEIQSKEDNKAKKDTEKKRTIESCMNAILLSLHQRRSTQNHYLYNKKMVNDYLEKGHSSESNAEIKFRDSDKEKDDPGGIDVNLKSSFSLLRGKFDSDKAYNHMEDAIAVARQKGIKPIRIILKGTDPDSVAELARRSYEAALANGYAKKDIQIVIPKECRPQNQRENKDIDANDTSYIWRGDEKTVIEKKAWNRAKARMQHVGIDSERVGKLQEQARTDRSKYFEPPQQQAQQNAQAAPNRAGPGQ